MCELLKLLKYFWIEILRFLKVNCKVKGLGMYWVVISVRMIMLWLRKVEMWSVKFDIERRILDYELEDVLLKKKCDFGK